MPRKKPRKTNVPAVVPKPEPPAVQLEPGQRAATAVAETVGHMVDQGFEVLIATLSDKAAATDRGVKQAIATMTKNRLVSIYAHKANAASRGNELATLSADVEIEATQGNLRDQMLDIGVPAERVEEYLDRLDAEHNS